MAYASGTKTPDIGTVTVTIASPAVFSRTNQLAVGDRVVFSTTGALPTGLVAGTVYYVIAAGLSGSAFEVSATEGGSAINTSGSQSGTHSMIAEHFLSSPSVAGTFVLVVDTVNLALGDGLELRVYVKVLAGGTPRVLYPSPRWLGAQSSDDMIKISVPVPNDLVEADALKFSLKQPLGAARAFPWKVIQI